MNKFLIAGLMSFFVVGCASKSDLNAVQNQVDALQVNLKDVRDTVNEAQAAAQVANTSALRAETALKEINEKLDRAFRKGALK
jgi:outer membrane murein-binding lipoprotein Lpp